MIHLRITHIVIFALLALLLTMSGAIADTPVGSAFTYQGNLSDGGTPATGIYDFQFRLFDAASGGNQESSTIVKQDVNVSNGLFNVGLDFGTIAFKGDARWLEIGVRPGSSTGSFTVLSPLQPVKPTPYAVDAPSAGTATAAPWSGLTGVPSGFSDNTDNTTTYTAGSGLTLTGTQFGVNTNAIQARVTGVCPTGEAIRVISSNGTVQCQKETDPKVGSIATNAVPKWDGTRLITGTWVDNGGKVSIGPAGLAAKLSVRINDPQIQNAGVFINENDAGSTETGVFAAAYGIGGTQHTGLFGQAEGGSHNRGVWGDARQDIGFPDFNYGGYFTAIGAVNNYAVWAESGDVYVRDQVGIRGSFSRRQAGRGEQL